MRTNLVTQIEARLETETSCLSRMDREFGPIVEPRFPGSQARGVACMRALGVADASSVWRDFFAFWTLAVRRSDKVGKI